MLPQTIECRACLLRPWRAQDKDALLRHANNRNIWRNLRDRFPHPYLASEAEAWLDRVAVPPRPEGIYAIDVAGEAVGSIGVDRHEDVQRHSAEVGYWLAEPFWGRGIVTEALRALTAAALAEADLWRLEAGVFAWNRASMRVLEKAGYLREGVQLRGAFKDGVAVDRVVYAITRDPGLPHVHAGD
jgi:RimJ/RimL family protein N-acetyltransferase